MYASHSIIIPSRSRDRQANGYDFWRRYRAPFWPAPSLSWVAPDPRTLEPVERVLAPNPEHDPFFDGDQAQTYQRAGDLDLWLVRRIAARRNFDPGFMNSASRWSTGR